MKKMYWKELLKRGENRVNWDNCNNKKVRFVYEDISGEIEIISVNTTMDLITIKYLNVEYTIKFTAFKTCNIKKIFLEKDVIFTNLKLANEIGCFNKVYRIKNNNDVLYVGSTNSLYSRMENHFHMHTPETKQIFEMNNWDRIEYLNIDENEIQTRMELLYIENLIINKYIGLKNINSAISEKNINYMSQERKIYLENIANSAVWEIYGTPKEE